MRPALLLSTLLFTSAAAAQIQPLPEGTVVPASPREQADVARRRKDVARWRKLVTAGPQPKKVITAGPQLLLFAEIGEPDRKRPGPIVRVPRLGAWPEDTATSYVVVLDDNRRVRLFQESPVSFSGDWTLDLTHVFDEDGRTVAFERSSRFFESGCSEVARERSTEIFDEAGRCMARDYRLEDGNEKPLDSKRCAFPYRDEYRIYSDAGSALQAARLVDVLSTAGVKLAR